MTPQLDFPIKFCAHSVERYRDRLRPGLTIEFAEAELQRIACHAQMSREAPEWLCSERQDAAVFLTIADATFPLVLAEDGSFFVAVTCLTKGSLSPEARERRNLRGRYRHSPTSDRSRGASVFQGDAQRY
jgi:hypothetical protein